MRVLLTGSEGQVGQAIIHRAQKDPEITLISTNKNTCDIADIHSIQKNSEEHKPHVIINCAAFTAVDKAESFSEKQTVDRVNIEGPKNLAKISHEKNILLLHLSTDYVFDGSKNSAYVETDAPHPINYYGKSKLLGEEEIKKNTENYLILRVSWVFSAYGKNPLKNLIKLMQEKETLNMVSDQIACPTYAGDIAEVLLQLVKKRDFKKGIFHYCNQPPISRYDLACWIRKTASKFTTIKTKEIIPITTEQFQTLATRPKNSVLKCNLFSDAFQIPLKNWEESMTKSIKESINEK